MYIYIYLCIEEGNCMVSHMSACPLVIKEYISADIVKC